MLLVRNLKGPAKAFTGTTAEYAATKFNITTPSATDLKQINWVVEAAGQRIAHFPKHGAKLRWELPDSLGGTTVRVMPYRNKPSADVSVVTSVVRGGNGGISPGGPKIVFPRAEGRKHFASVDGGPDFYVGTDVAYQGNRGLMNTTDQSGAVYSADEFRDEFGFWADFLRPTARGESSGRYHCINTYDRAEFTFGFIQWAAHTPNQNFVPLLRRLLHLPAARSYFPELRVEDGRILRQTENGAVTLETSNSTEALRRYFNPSRATVDTAEVVNAAKMIDWCMNDPAHRRAQVAQAVEQMKKGMIDYSARYGLDGVADKVCLVVADIRHQGRAKSAAIIEALHSTDAFKNLLRLGGQTYKARIDALRAEIGSMEAEGRIGTHIYRAGAQDFVRL